MTPEQRQAAIERVSKPLSNVVKITVDWDGWGISQSTHADTFNIAAPDIVIALKKQIDTMHGICRDLTRQAPQTQ